MQQFIQEDLDQDPDADNPTVEAVHLEENPDGTYSGYADITEHGVTQRMLLDVRTEGTDVLWTLRPDPNTPPVLVDTPGGRVGVVRFATFNASLSRSDLGQLIQDLSTPDDPQARAIAQIIQINNPDVLVLNEFDYDSAGTAAQYFRTHYLEVSQNGDEPVFYPYVYVAPSNTGIPSGHDLDNDGSVGGPGDAYGYGTYEGQYAFVIFSRYPIDTANIRTFQTFRWVDIPNPILPTDPNDSDRNGDYTNWYTDQELADVRLSSKNHVDVPILIQGQTIHALVAHPTPPVFDGFEDRNGLRNGNEIRFWADYITPGYDDYIYDDNGIFGGLEDQADFVILGDLNADPHDGESADGAAEILLNHFMINTTITPTAPGGSAHADANHRGDPLHDTADFPNPPGNLRVDYVLPSHNLLVLDAGVYWPTDALGAALVTHSDHRLVWVDIELDRATD